MTSARLLRLSLASIIAMIVLSVVAVAQPQAVTRLEGFILDEQTGQPVGCKMTVYNEAGKKVRSTKSNSKDGSFLVVLNDAGKHRVVLSGHNVYKDEYYVEVPKSTDFQDIKQNFNVNSFVEGKQLASVIGFEMNSAVLSAEGLAAMKEIKKAMDDNQQLRVNIHVTADVDQITQLKNDSLRAYLEDSLAYAKDLKKFEKKYRRKKEKPDPPEAPEMRMDPDDPNDQLLQDRKKAIASFLKDTRNLDIRLTITIQPLDAMLIGEQTPKEEILKELTAKKKKSKKKSKSKPSTQTEPAHPGHPTLVANIGKVARLFE